MTCFVSKGFVTYHGSLECEKNYNYNCCWQFGGTCCPPIFRVCRVFDSDMTRRQQAPPKCQSLLTHCTSYESTEDFILHQYCLRFCKCTILNFHKTSTVNNQTIHKIHLLFLVTQKNKKDNVPSRTVKYSRMSLKFKQLMETGLTARYSSWQTAQGCKQSGINTKHKL